MDAHLGIRESLVGGEGLVALVGCALLKASLSSGRAAPEDRSEWERH